MPARGGAFAFVSTDGHGRPKATDRKLIRSHCMRGKNVRKTSHRPRPPSSDEVESTVRDSGSTGLTLTLTNGGGRFTNVETQDGEAEHANGHPLVQVRPPAPRGLPQEILMVRFAADIDDYAKNLVYMFFSVVKTSMYPIDLCVDYSIYQSDWFEWLFEDPAYLHATIMTTSAIQDLVLQRELTPTTYYHFRKVLSLLNERLSLPNSHAIDSIVSTVVTLAMAAEFIGDMQGWETHVSGLRKIVKLRGGLSSFAKNPQLLIKVARVDFGLSMHTGGELQFYGASDHDHLQAFSSGAPLGAQLVLDGDWERVRPVVSLLDPRLVGIFRELREFAVVASVLPKTKERMQPEFFQGFLASVQYRLIQLRGTLDSVLGESARIGMLAFVTTSHMQLPNTQLRYSYLAARLKECCCSVEASSPALETFVLWLLTMAAVSVSDISEPWLLSRVSGLVKRLDLSWEGARARLQSVLWIDCIHDSHGRKMFDAVLGSKA